MLLALVTIATRGWLDPEAGWLLWDARSLAASCFRHHRSPPNMASHANAMPTVLLRGLGGRVGRERCHVPTLMYIAFIAFFLCCGGLTSLVPGLGFVITGDT